MTHSRPTIRELLDSASLAPRRDLGQNFVADPNTVRRIAELAHVGAGDRVVEIGAGLGWAWGSLGDTTIGDQVVFERLITSRVVREGDFPERYAEKALASGR